MEVSVTHGKSVYTSTFSSSSSIEDVKEWLEGVTCVSIEKQVLMFAPPVVKEYRRATSEHHRVLLSSLLPPHHMATSEGSVKVRAMLVGTPETELRQQPQQLSAESNAIIARIVSTTQERESRWFRCSYGENYLRQTAYVCRTCVLSGMAAPDHAICLACSAVCHAMHMIEEWGVRYHFRCDCCTSKCSLKCNPSAPQSASDPKTCSHGGSSASATTTITSEMIEARTKRKRSRSPLKSPTVSGPVVGIRVPAVINSPSPFAIHDPPENEREAINMPITLHTTGASAPPSVSAAQVLAENEEELKEKVPTADPPPEFEGCRFILDSSTDKPPALTIPPNLRNRYPRNPLTWCFCEEDEVEDDDTASCDDGGLVCMLCTTCYWSSHMKAIHSDQYRRVPCYGDVVQGETVVFKCNTCRTYVCTPCRHRCHKDHDVAEETLVTSEVPLVNPFTPTSDGSPTAPGVAEAAAAASSLSPGGEPVDGSPAGALFSCGCRGLCSIAESMSKEEAEDPSTYLPLSAATAIELMRSDIFTGFICAHCMQEYPWLLTNELKHCYHGKLPEKVTTALPVIPCKQTSCGPEYYPYHGMIYPITGFTEESICSCAPCQEAFHAFAPWARDDATHMMMNTCDQCDACHRSIKHKEAFLCQNCEMSMTDPFLLCAECNAHREALVEASQRRIVALDITSTGSTPTPTPPPQVSEATAVDPTYTNSDGVAVTYTHDLSHNFLEDTQENLYALCGMQIMNTMDQEDRQYISEHLDELKDFTPEFSLQSSFGPVPINFSQEDLKEFARANAKKD